MEKDPVSRGALGVLFALKGALGSALAEVLAAVVQDYIYRPCYLVGFQRQWFCHQRIALWHKLYRLQNSQDHLLGLKDPCQIYHLCIVVDERCCCPW